MLAALEDAAELVDGGDDAVDLGDQELPVLLAGGGAQEVAHP